MTKEDVNIIKSCCDVIFWNWQGNKLYKDGKEYEPENEIGLNFEPITLNDLNFN